MTPADFAREERRAVALLAGLALLAGPRRTRPLAGFLYGVALSRVHGAARQRESRHVATTVGQLFDQKTSVGARVDDLELAVDDLDRVTAGLRRSITDLAMRVGPAPDGYVDPAMDSGAQG